MTRTFFSALCASLIALSTAAAQSPQILLRSPFPDVPGTSEFAEAILYMRDESIVGGYPDGTFRPLQGINRAELVKVVVGTLAPAGDIASCFFRDPVLFSDTPPYFWYGKYLCVAKERGIIGGYPDLSFRPANLVNVSEAAKILAWSFGVSSPEETDPQAPWFKRYVDALASRGALPTTIRRFDDPLSRGELAEIIYRLRENISDRPSLNYHALSGIKPSSSAASSVSDGWDRASSEAPFFVPLSSVSSRSSRTPFPARPGPDLSKMSLVVDEECDDMVHSLDPLSYKPFHEADPNVFEDSVVLLRFRRFCFPKQFVAQDADLQAVLGNPSLDPCPTLSRFLAERERDERLVSADVIEALLWGEAANMARHEWYAHGCSASADQSMDTSVRRSVAAAKLYQVLDRPESPEYADAFSLYLSRF